MVSDIPAQPRRGRSFHVSRCLPPIYLEHHGAFPCSFNNDPLSFHSQHVIVDANHVWQGFISSGNPDQFFEDISKDTFKNALYELETLVGDAILVSSVRFPCLTRTQLDRTRSTDAMLYGSELSYSSFPS